MRDLGRPGTVILRLMRAAGIAAGVGDAGADDEAQNDGHLVLTVSLEPGADSRGFHPLPG